MIKIFFLSLFCLFGYSILYAQSDPVGATNLVWKQAPQIPAYTNKEINCTNKKVVLIIVADEFGKIERVLIKQGSGNQSLDDQIQKAVLKASLNPDSVKSVDTSGKVFFSQEIILKQRESKFLKWLGIKTCY